MKNPLTIRERFNEPMLFAFIVIAAPRYHIRRKPIWVLIDTGSPWVGITPYDALGSNIPFSALRVASEYPIVNFGGHKFKRLLLTDAQLLMRDETGQIAQFNISSVSVLNPRRNYGLKSSRACQVF